MKTTMFFLLAVAALSEPLERKASHYFIREVFVEGQGPFRFLLDTGAEASAVSERVAAQVGLRPEYRVEQVTVAGSQITPAGRARLRVGDSEVPDAEVLIGGFTAKADGVLGQSFLRHFDYLITRESIEIDAEPIEGQVLPMRLRNGSPVVNARVDGDARELMLDSGAPAVLLFGSLRQPEMQKISTNSGSVYGSRARVLVSLGDVRRRMDAVWLPGKRVGLLPVAAFRAVYVSNSERYVVVR